MRRYIMWWIYPVYALDLAAMIVLAFWLGNLVDMLDKKTKVSGAFIGGVLLAAVTSLPELFTALSAVFIVNEPEYVVGDILGSIIFNLVVLMLETVMFVKNFRKSNVKKFHVVNGLFCLAMYGFAAYAFFAPKEWQLMLGDINFVSLLILALYIVSLIIQPKEEQKEEVKEQVAWSLKKIITLFVFCSIGLIGTSIALTYLTKMIQEALPVLSGSVAGALLLGIGTSIPEVISTAQLFKKKNYDAGIGNMVGSCTFDFAIFAFADCLSCHPYNTHVAASGEFIICQRGLSIVSPDAIQFEIYGAIVCALVTGFLALKVYTPLLNKSKGWTIALSSVTAAACLALYLVIFFF